MDEQRDRRAALDVKYVDNEELHDSKAVRRLMREAEAILDSEDAEEGNRTGKRQQPSSSSSGRAGAGNHGDEVTLFKALHACGHALQQMSERRRVDKKKTDRVTDLRYRIFDELVNRNIGLVYDMRRRTRVYNVDHDDLISEGFWALYQATANFDPWRGFRFSTYACTSILRAYLLVGRMHARRAEQRKATAERTETTVGAESEPALDKSLRSERLLRALEGDSAELTPTERFVLERRFFHANRVKPESLESVGRLISVSKERVRQIQVSALEKLRAVLSRDPIFANGDEVAAANLN